MIRLAKQVEPEVLAVNAEAWRDEYVNHISDPEMGDPPARYAHAAIKDALRIETREKCAYCESRILHVTYEHVEHILPKRHRPELVVTWTNLTLACPRCNVNKGEYYSETEPLLNPYQDEPAEHLLFVGDLALPRPGSDMGLRSIERLQLSRPGLVEQRRERIRRLHPLIDTWAREVRPATKTMLEEQIRREAADEADYAAAVRSYLLHVGFPPQQVPASVRQAPT